VRAVLKNVEFGRDSGFAERHVKSDAVFHGHGSVRCGVKKKSRRSLRGDALIVGKIFYQLGIRSLAQ
jgi:hypothetical protein